MSAKSDSIESITQFLFIGMEEKHLEPNDLVIVLGNNFARQTMKEVSALYNSGKIARTAKIILTGATGALNAGHQNECDQMFEYAVNEFHMPESLFIKETRATNASENLAFSREMILQNGGFEAYQRILFVGNSFMMRRVSMYAAKQGYPAAKLQYYGVVDREGRNIGPDTWWQTEIGRDRVMAEIERIGKYYKSGDLGLD